MWKYFLFCLLIVNFVGISIVSASESVPRKEFISITEKVIDTLDEIESTLSNSNKILIDSAFQKYDVSEKKYHRYLKKSWEGEQGYIALALFDAHLNFDIMRHTKDLRTTTIGSIGESYLKGVAAKQKALDLFLKYKNNKSN